MILKIWNDDSQCFTYVDNVKIVQKEYYWADTNFPDDALNILYKINRGEKGGLYINSSCIKLYARDFRGLKQRENINDVQGNPSLTDKDSISNDVYVTHVLEIEYIDGSHESITIGNSDDNFILNEKGQTIDRL